MTSTLPPPALFAELRFMRLKWSLFRPVSEIQPDHPLASQSATDPPRHRMIVVLDSVESWEYWHDAEAMDDRPLPLVIDNKNGEMVTIGQFVTQVHAYASSIKTVVYDCLAVPSTRDDVEFYYDGCLSPRASAAAETDVTFSVCMMDDYNLPIVVEAHWGNVVKWVQHWQAVGG
ncbi:hypothetical protein PG991_010739 [Apiospora marii]|uniref:Uncharacterized protein n=1 Tax=Apiospora marii TaxID=335849 RepID=A0ABR1RC85_9PEZI